MKHGGWFYCTLNFYYHMMGATVGTLNVYVETPDDGDLGVSSECTCLGGVFVGFFELNCCDILNRA